MAKMAQPLRSLNTALALAVRLRPPVIADHLASPHEQRIAKTIPRAFRRTPKVDVHTEDHEVIGRGGAIPVRVYTRRGTPPGAPGYFFIHGGGFMEGGIAHCDHLCRELAARSGFVVVGVSYRLSPPHPFPAGLEDCQDVLTWMATERPGGLDADRIAVAGESAGGNFTIALAIWARDTDGPRIAHQAPIYPLTDFTGGHIAWEDGTLGNPGITPQVWDEVSRSYLPSGDLADPGASVLFAEHHDLPPALVVTCEHDILRNEGIALAEAYAEAGVDTSHVHMDDMPHGYLLMTRLTRRASQTLDLMVAEAGKHLR